MSFFYGMQMYPIFIFIFIVLKFLEQRDFQMHDDIASSPHAASAFYLSHLFTPTLFIFLIPLLQKKWCLKSKSSLPPFLPLTPTSNFPRVLIRSPFPFPFTNISSDYTRR